MVGARGFEPPTTGTPCRCATRLRYAPKKEYIGKIGGWNRSRTGVHGFAGRCMTTLPSSLNGLQCKKNGAGNEIRTRDPDLGKVVLYQLSYSRFIQSVRILHCSLLVSTQFIHSSAGDGTSTPAIPLQRGKESKFNSIQFNSIQLPIRSYLQQSIRRSQQILNRRFSPRYPARQPALRVHQEHP